VTVRGATARLHFAKADFREPGAVGAREVRAGRDSKAA